ncbi:MAG: single-stranded DNA-binding protein [Spirochaetia bacterium]|nr:single-stranded DNA-binding protein [Spirochaetia bacterium]
MANDINRVVLVGRLTRDPELKSTNTGNYFCRFTLASNRSFYKKEGDNRELKEEVGFFDCVAWGKLAEIISKYLQKGRRLGVDGSLRFSSWENTEGKKQSKVEVFVENFQFLDAKGEGSSTGSPSQSSSVDDLSSESAFPSSGGSDADLDDIPF